MKRQFHPRSRSLALALLAAIVLPSMVGCPSSEPAAPQPETEAPEEDQPPAPVVERAPPSLPVLPPEIVVPPRQPDPEDGPPEAPDPTAPVADPPVAEPGAEKPPLSTNPLRNGQPAPPSDTQPDTAEQSRPRKGKKGDGDFDPIAVHGPIFVDWPKPKLALVITGRQDGYMEPCGCAGLDRMKGGMSRRHSLFRELREKRAWPTVGLDAGGIARDYGKQAELKFHIMVDSMRTMQYDAVTLGSGELRLPTAELVAVAASMGDQPSMFLSANVGLFGFDAGLTATHRVVERAGVTIGITGVLGPEAQKAINNPEIELAATEAAIEKVLPQLEAADYQVLLAHATLAESEALARKFPGFDIVVTAGGAAEPPAQPRKIEGTDTLLIEVGEKGMDAIVLGLYDGAEPTWRYQRVPLDSRFPQSEEMHLLMTAYQHQVKSLGFSGLGIRAAPHPLKETHGEFVGSKSCESCHEPSYRIWRRTPHAKAFETLVELDPPRQFDPECISCHVVGWHPTKYFPYEGGYTSLEETPHLIDVGCESCHGPGGNHNRAELHGTDEEKERYRKAMVITKAESRESQCATCHDLDNSPDFDFDTYWPDVEHYEY